MESPAKPNTNAVLRAGPLELDGPIVCLNHGRQCVGRLDVSAIHSASIERRQTNQYYLFGAAVGSLGLTLLQHSLDVVSVISPTLGSIATIAGVMLSIGCAVVAATPQTKPWIVIDTINGTVALPLDDGVTPEVNAFVAALNKPRGKSWAAPPARP